MKAKTLLSSLAGAKADVPPAKPIFIKTLPGYHEFECFEIREAAGEVQFVETGGGRRMSARAEHVKRLTKAEGQRYERLRVQEGKYAVKS